MRDESAWVPTKYVQEGERWRASRDPAKLARGSRLIGDILAEVYSAAIERHARGDLLDLGCGEVPLYGMYRAHVTSVTCVDWAGSLHGTRHADILTDLNESCPMPDAAFDTVVCTDVIEHLRDPGRLFADVSRLLKPGGKLILSTPYLYPQHERPHDYFRCSDSALRLLATRSQLDVQELRPYGGYPHVMATLLLKAVQRSRIASALVERTAALIIAMLGTRALNPATKFPLGYLLVAAKPST